LVRKGFFTLEHYSALSFRSRARRDRSAEERKWPGQLCDLPASTVAHCSTPIREEGHGAVREHVAWRQYQSIIHFNRIVSQSPHQVQ